MNTTLSVKQHSGATTSQLRFLAQISQIHFWYHTNTLLYSNKNTTHYGIKNKNKTTVLLI